MCVQECVCAHHPLSCLTNHSSSGLHLISGARRPVITYQQSYLIDEALIADMLQSCSLAVIIMMRNTERRDDHSHSRVALILKNIHLFPFCHF